MKKKIEIRSEVDYGVEYIGRYKKWFEPEPIKWWEWVIFPLAFGRLFLQPFQSMWEGDMDNEMIYHPFKIYVSVFTPSKTVRVFDELPVVSESRELQMSKSHSEYIDEKHVGILCTENSEVYRSELMVNERIDDKDSFMRKEFRSGRTGIDGVYRFESVGFKFDIPKFVKHMKTKLPELGITEDELINELLNTELIY